MPVNISAQSPTGSHVCALADRETESTGLVIGDTKSSGIEGGYFKASILSEDNFNSEKKLYSSIYFLLRTGEVSNFHRLTADELWYYHAGEALTIYMITKEGKLITKQLGLDIEKGEEPQILVEKAPAEGTVP